MNAIEEKQKMAVGFFKKEGKKKKEPQAINSIECPGIREGKEQRGKLKWDTEL